MTPPRTSHFLLASTLALALCVAPITSVQAAGLIGKGEVRSSGREAAKQVEKEYGLLPDASAQARVQRIGNGLARIAKYQEGTVYAFQIVNMDEVNAFALPDGHIYVTSGLIKEVKDDDALLAAVLGHEIGHLSELHAYRRVERVLRQESVLTVVDILFGKKIGKSGKIIASLTHAVITSEYSQDQEIEADQYGIVLTSRAKYGAESMSTFLRKLGEKEKNPGVLKYIQSHPTSKDRVKHADAFMREYKLNRVKLADFTKPLPPTSAFDYEYPDFAQMEREAKDKASTGKSKSKDSGTASEPTTRSADV